MPQDDDVSLGGLIKDLRARRGIRTQAELAQRAGISPGMVGHIESGTRSVSAENLEAIANALSVSARDRHALRLARAKKSDELATPRRPATIGGTPRHAGDNTVETLRSEVTRLAEVVNKLSDEMTELRAHVGLPRPSVAR